jgi:hypothetical protein
LFTKVAQAANTQQQAEFIYCKTNFSLCIISQSPLHTHTQNAMIFIHVSYGKRKIKSNLMHQMRKKLNFSTKSKLILMNCVSTFVLLCAIAAGVGGEEKEAENGCKKLKCNLLLPTRYLIRLTLWTL